MLSNKQKRYLRKEAHQLKPIFQIGKSGIHETFIKEIIDALETRELVKISILQNALEDPKDAGELLEGRTGAELVQVIGSTIILYKESRENKQINLPN